MLLRRITQHVKDQNWFAVFVDFIIVVVGILIAFQITEWNEARNNEKLEKEVLVAILKDIENDKKSINTGLSFIQSNINTSSYLLNKSGIPVPKNFVVAVENVHGISGFEYKLNAKIPDLELNQKGLWKNATIRYHPNQSNSAFSSLIAAGDLSLIKDDNLVRALQRYSQLWEGLENAHASTYRPFRNQLVFVAQKYGLSPFSEMSEDKLVTLLTQNPELSSSLRTMLEFVVLHREQTSGVDRLADELIKQLTEKIQ